jgi:hypothetical protein
VSEISIGLFKGCQERLRRLLIERDCAGEFWEREWMVFASSSARVPRTYAHVKLSGHREYVRWEFNKI